MNFSPPRSKFHVKYRSQLFLCIYCLLFYLLTVIHVNVMLILLSGEFPDHTRVFFLFTLSTSLFMFHFIFFRPHFIVHVSSHFLHSTLYCSCFILFLLVHSPSISFISFTKVYLIHLPYGKSSNKRPGVY